MIYEKKTVAVIGGGAAGMMAAVTAAENGASVTVFEKNGAAKTGRKLGITGKGRCNLTNDCTLEEFIENIPHNPRFLYAAYSAFPPQKVMEWFTDAGVKLKTERGRRVFPESDKASDIVFALTRALRRTGCSVCSGNVTDIRRTEEGFCVRWNNECRVFEKVILCTGGLSYPVTGSTGDGYTLASALGHTVTELKPSLVPLVSRGSLCPSMQGLSLRNTAMKVVNIENGKTVYSDFGEIMFTHFGLTGPMALSASARIGDACPGKYRADLDLKPALDEKTLDARLLSDFTKNINRDYSNSLSELLPSKMIGPFVVLSGIPATEKVNSITREQRRKIVSLLKCFSVNIDGLRPIEEAIITTGGISVKEINPKTMESKLVPGLYFAGEIIDADGYTGGYNLQIAWSTGFLAGRASAE